MKRRTLLTMCGAAVAGTAGCLGDDGSGLPDSLQWSTTTDGDADATVSEQDEIDLRVYRCSTAAARSDLGELSGTLEITFDYTVEADGWYEIPSWDIVVDGDPAYSSRDSDAQGISREEYETVSETVQTEVSVDGDTTIVFRLEQSDKCSNLDHENTYFRVRGLSLNLE